MVENSDVEFAQNILIHMERSDFGQHELFKNDREIEFPETVNMNRFLDPEQRNNRISIDSRRKAYWIGSEDMALHSILCTARPVVEVR
jgi:hypothetical protein